MENNYLAQILPFLNEIEEERRKQFEEYFRTAPMWLMETFVVEELEKGTIFVQEGEPADTVFLIGKGLIKATDYRIYGINYDFTVFDKVYAFGGMEVIIDLDKYQTTLQTVTKCTVLKIPKEGFKKWLDSDITALQQESRLMTGPGQPDAVVPSGSGPGGFPADETVPEICGERSHEDERRPPGAVGLYRTLCKDHQPFYQKV